MVQAMTSTSSTPDFMTNFQDFLRDGVKAAVAEAIDRDALTLAIIQGIKGELQGMPFQRDSEASSPRHSTFCFEATPSSETDLHDGHSAWRESVALFETAETATNDDRNLKGMLKSSKVTQHMKTASSTSHIRTVIADGMRKTRPMDPEDVDRYKFHGVYQRLKVRVRNWVTQGALDYASAVAIILNAVLLGAQTEYVAQNFKQEQPLPLRILELVFSAAFTLELVLRLIVFRCGFFCQAGFLWNWLDLVLVCLQLAEEVAVVLLHSMGGTDDDEKINFGVMRIFRLLRTVRFVRLARLCHLVDELRMLVVSILSSGRSLMWTLVLLCLIMYILGMCIVQSVTLELISGSHTAGTEIEELLQYFGSLGSAFFSLYRAITGGITWGDISTPLLEHSFILVVAFSCYVGFAVLALFNIVTGTFVEGAIESAKADKTDLLVGQVQALFKKELKDGDGDGFISWPEFQSKLSDPDMIAVLDAFNVTADEVRFLFDIIDSDRSGSLSPSEFIEGAVRLRQPSKVYDCSLLARQQDKLANQLEVKLVRVEKSLDVVMRALSRIERPNARRSQMELPRDMTERNPDFKCWDPSYWSSATNFEGDEETFEVTE